MKFVKNVLDFFLPSSRGYGTDPALRDDECVILSSPTFEDDNISEQGTSSSEDKKVYIGIVDWFNTTKRYGVIHAQRSTLKLPPAEKIDGQIALFFYISYPYEADFKPGDWVEFSSVELKVERNGYLAKKVNHLAPREKMLSMALKFRGPAATISVAQPSGEVQEYYVLEEILFRLLYHVRVSPAKIRQEITRTLRYVSSAQRETVVREIVSEPHNREILRDLYLPLKSTTPLASISAASAISRLFSQMASLDFIQEYGMARLVKTAQWHDLMFRHNLIYSLIAYETNIEKALIFANCFEKVDILQSFPDYTDANLAYSARVALANVLDDPLWLSNFSPQTWQSFAQWLSACDYETKAWVLWNYYANKSTIALERTPLISIIDDHTLAYFIQEFNAEEAECKNQQALLSLLLEKCLLENNALTASALKLGITLPTLSVTLNRVASKNPQSVVQFFQAFYPLAMCSLQEICAYLYDTALICLFIATGDYYPLYCCHNLEYTHDFWKKLDSHLIQKFLTLYLPPNAPPINPNDDLILAMIGAERISVKKSDNLSGSYKFVVDNQSAADEPEDA